MNLVKQSIKDGVWTITLYGHIDSGNAPTVLEQLKDDTSVTKVIVDASDLEYLSSAGLRILLRLRKSYPNTQIINVSSELYEILEMTGFTEMLTVRKAFRQMSVDGCPVIGKGSNGIVYRTDPETIVKVYFNKDALPEILHERDVARKALILGIPTAISYDVVKVGEGYGSVFELLNTDSLSSLILAQKNDLTNCVSIYVDMLRSIHAIEARPGEFPDVKETALNWARFLENYLPETTYQKLITLISAVPQDNHLVHGDYHTNNLMCQKDETLLIDMDTLSQGHPVFEFATMFLAYKGFHILNPEGCEAFLGYDADTAYRFWRLSLSSYYNTTDEDLLQLIEDRSSVVGYTRLMRRTIRRIGFDDPDGKALIKICKEKLITLCDRLNSLI